AQISGIQSTPTAFEYFSKNPFKIPIPTGKSLKDFYGKNISYTIQPPCGASFQNMQNIPFPWVQSVIKQNCNLNFKAAISVKGLVCYPVSYSIKNIASGAVYGPF